MPIVAWYNGGPGSSSLFGWFQEGISPYVVQADLSLGDGAYAWTRFANIICVDNPVGVGFSYTGSGAYRTSEEQIGADMGMNAYVSSPMCNKLVVPTCSPSL